MSLTEPERQASGAGVELPECPERVPAWVRYPERSVQVEGEAVGFNERAVLVRFLVIGGGHQEAWVWRSAVTKRRAYRSMKTVIQVYSNAGLPERGWRVSGGGGFLASEIGRVLVVHLSAPLSPATPGVNHAPRPCGMLCGTRLTPGSLRRRAAYQMDALEAWAVFPTRAAVSSAIRKGLGVMITIYSKPNCQQCRMPTVPPVGGTATNSERG